MTSENQAQNPYDAVLADLRAQRDKIDQTIILLTALRNGAAIPSAQTEQASDAGIVETAGMFLGMSIVDAAKKLMAMRKRTMGNVEIAREIQAGGLVLTGKDPVNVVGSVLSRRFNDVGDVVKVGRGIWGLKEWYPGRNFKPAAKAPLTGFEGGIGDAEEALNPDVPNEPTGAPTVADRFFDPN